MHQRINHCRICKNSELSLVVDLGSQALTECFQRAVKNTFRMGRWSSLNALRNPVAADSFSYGIRTNPSRCMATTTAIDRA